MPTRVTKASRDVRARNWVEGPSTLLYSATRCALEALGVSRDLPHVLDEVESAPRLRLISLCFVTWRGSVRGRTGCCLMLPLPSCWMRLNSAPCAICCCCKKMLPCTASNCKQNRVTPLFSGSKSARDALQNDLLSCLPLNKAIIPLVAICVYSIIAARRSPRVDLRVCRCRRLDSHTRRFQHLSTPT